MRRSPVCALDLLRHERLRHHRQGGERKEGEEEREVEELKTFFFFLLSFFLQRTCSFGDRQGLKEGGEER